MTPPLPRSPARLLTCWFRLFAPCSIALKSVSIGPPDLAASSQKSSFQPQLSRQWPTFRTCFAQRRSLRRIGGAGGTLAPDEHSGNRSWISWLSRFYSAFSPWMRLCGWLWWWFPTWGWHCCAGVAQAPYSDGTCPVWSETGSPGLSLSSHAS